MIRNVPSWAPSFVGLPFRVAGRSRDGVDCYGLYWLIQRDVFGRDLPAFVETFSPADVEEIRGLIEGRMSPWVPVDHPQPGDAVLLRVSGLPGHLGIYLRRGLMLHVNDTAGSSQYEELGGLAWPPAKILGYYAWGQAAPPALAVSHG